MSYFSNYECKWIDATKTHTRGRASGGFLFGFKKNLKQRYGLRFGIIGELDVLHGKFDGENIVFVPVYLNSWNTDFEKLQNALMSNEIRNFFILGDLNARTSNFQTFEKYILEENTVIDCKRKSKDAVLDGNGRMVLDFLNDTGGVILNGRTPADPDGEMTFVGGRGMSVIDYACCSLDAIKWVKDLQVVSKPYSDHLPLKLVLKNNYNPELDSNLKLLPKLYWPKSNGLKYAASMQRLCDEQTRKNYESVDKEVDHLKEKIYSVAKSQRKPTNFSAENKWFDFQCYNSRKQVFNKLNVCRKFGNIESLRQNYLESKRKHKMLCDQKRKSYELASIEKLNQVKDSSTWWKLANEMRNRKYIINGNISLSEFVDHFSQLLSPDIQPLQISYAEPQNYLPLLDSSIDLCELKLVLKQAKEGKAPGIDRIPYEYYKYAPDEFLVKLLHAIDNIFVNETIPDSFRKSIIFPLFKKGDCSMVGNYRGLSFIDTLCKIFTGILLNRINKWIEVNKILHESQAGFRKKYSTVDNIFNLSSIVQLQFNKKEKLYAFFVDFKAAFDTINREALFYKLYAQGMSSKMVRLLKELYRKTTSAVWNGNQISEFFEIRLGVKQGCLLSPTLFALYINDLYDHLPGGIHVKNSVVKLLMYADDLVLVAKDEKTLQVMIDKLVKYCTFWNLIVNLDKSKILVFRKGARLSISEKWYYNNDPIEVVNQYKYLGVLLTYNMSFNKHLSEKLTASKNAINYSWTSILKNKNILPSKKVKVFEAASRSILCYAGQVWGFQEYEQVEKLQRYFLKRSFNLPNNTPNYMLHVETGLHRLFLFTLKLHFSYINKIISYTEDRYPKLLALEIIEKKLFWAKEWLALSQKSSIDFNFSFQLNSWKPMQTEMLNKLAVIHWNEHVERARQSQFHDMYCNLRYFNVPNYFNDKNATEMISIIFKARGGLLNINARAFKAGTVGLCSLCNMDEVENTFHFVSECPIFKPYRLLYFKKASLTYEEFIEILNGKDYAFLFRYLKAALKYRWLLINEYD